MWEKLFFRICYSLNSSRIYPLVTEPNDLLPCSLQPDLNLSHNFTSCFCKIHFNIILPLMPRYPKWLLSFSFQTIFCTRIFIYSVLLLLFVTNAFEYVNVVTFLYWWLVIGSLFYKTFSITTLYSINDGVTREWWWKDYVGSLFI
jgi:hypothetical protein